jgi:hypothetical protein
MTTSSATDVMGQGATDREQRHTGSPAHTPTLVAVRVGGHTDFDRVVFEFRGDRPGYQVSYVDQVVQDGSGEPIHLDGRAFLRVSLFPAIAHNEQHPDRSTFGRLPAVAGLATLRDLAEAGDFEAVVSFGIGVAGRRPFQVSRLSAPSRIAIDIGHVPPRTGDATLSRGDSGAAVATWQWRLRLALGSGITVDEDFGPATEAATRDFQRDHGLGVDGVVGRRTRAAMEQALGI